MINRYASLRQGLVGAWCPSVQRCGSGFTLPDLSGYGNNGSLVNMDPGTDWVAGRSGLALDFDGSNDYVSIVLGQISDAINNNVFSVCLWGYVRSFGNSPVLIAAGSNSSPPKDSLLLETNNTGSQLYVKSANNTEGLSGARTYTLSTALQASQWFNIVFIKTATGNNGSLYVNNILQSSFTGTLSTSVTTSSNSLTIAAYTNFSVPLNGQLDDIRIYNRALTPSEIQLLYTGGRGVGLVPERIKHRRKTTAAAFKAAWARRQQHIGSGVY